MVRYGALFVFFILLAFGIHLGFLFILTDQPFRHEIIGAYAANFTVAFGLFIVTAILIRKMGGMTVYLIFSGWLLKAGLYLFIFKPVYQLNDGLVDKAEFFTYFIPFAVCLILEITLLIRLINGPTTNTIDKTSL